MKKLLFLIFSSCLVLGAIELEVPVLWQRRKAADGPALEAIGFMYNKDMAVWALKYHGLQEVLKAPRFLISLYMDTDSTTKTGRKPGADGNDFQLNIQVGPRTLSAIDWRGGRFQRIPLYDDDYLITHQDDVLYIIIRGEPLENMVKFSDRMAVRVLSGSNNKSMPIVTNRIDLRKTLPMKLKPLTFYRFGAERTALQKKAEAVLIPRSDELKLWNTYGERYQENEKMPPVVATAKNLRISAARGEREAVHFAITGEKSFKSLEIIPGNLKSDNGRIIPANQLVVAYVGFAPTVREEFFTDILYRSYQAQNSPNHFALIGITVPRDAIPGVYRGEARLVVDGKEREPLQLELEIYPFTLPERRSFKTAYTLKPSYIKNHFGRISAAEMQAEFSEQTRIAREFRFSPRLPHVLPKLTWTKDEKLIIDWRQFDQVIKQYFDEYKFTVFQDSMFQIGSHGGPLYSRIRKLLGDDIKTSDPRFEKFFYQLVKQTRDHYKELGILDRCIFFIWDEPYGSVYPDIRRCCAIAKKAAPEIKWAVAIDHMPEQLTNDINIWCTNFLTLYNLRKNPATANHRVWCYNKVGMESFREPASVPRLYYWLARRYNIECYEYSEINAWRLPHKGKRPDTYYNNWVNYIWLYPDKKPGSPFASLRMVLSADGMDDYDYLQLFEERFGKDKLPVEVKAAFPELLPGGHIKFPVGTNRRMQEIREIIARKLSGK